MPPEGLSVWESGSPRAYGPRARRRSPWAEKIVSGSPIYYGWVVAALVSARRGGRRESEQNIGSPHHHAWQALVQTVIGSLEKHTPQDANLQNPQQHQQEFLAGPNASFARLQTQVRFCLIRTAFQKDTRRLEIHFIHGTD